MKKIGVFINKYADYLVIFVLDAIGMILELVAARLMTPYFGNSNFVWTAIIGIILLAGALGNIIGGKISSLKLSRFLACVLLLFAAIYIAVTPLIEYDVLKPIGEWEAGIQAASVVGSIIFFLIPSTILGIIPPIVMKEKIGPSKDQGKESGRITAVIALGSLLGTFAGGFWLIPVMGTKVIFVLIAICITILTPLFQPLKNNKNRNLTLFLIFIWIVAFITSVASFITLKNLNINSAGISIDTEYGRIMVVDDIRGGDAVRYYKQSGAYSSATYTDKELRNELVFDYMKKYDEMFEFRDVNNVAMIGGAAYQYPKYYISHFPKKRMDVIEIDPKATEIAKKYFFLDELLAEYGEDRLGLYNEDGRLFLANSDTKYDAILNDAFSGEVPVGEIATVEAAKIIKDSLSENGVYMSNVLGAVSGSKGKFLRAEVKTLKQVFKKVYVASVYNRPKKDAYINWMVIATDNTDYVPSKLVDIDITDEDIILTDDYNPVDSLVTTEYFD